MDLRQENDCFYRIVYWTKWSLFGQFTFGFIWLHCFLFSFNVYGHISTFPFIFLFYIHRMKKVDLFEPLL